MTDAYELSQRSYDRFVTALLGQYAALEHALRRHLQNHVRLSDEIYDIVVGFPRTTELVAKLKEVIALTIEDEAVKAQAAAIFGQLTVITKLRDRVVHFGGHPLDNGKIMIRTKPTEIVLATGKPYALYEITDLFAAYTELMQITSFLSFHLGVVVRADGSFLTGEELAERQRQCAPPRKWRYSNPRLVKPDRQRRAAGGT